mgnify:CR=1 FL=1
MSPASPGKQNPDWGNNNDLVENPDDQHLVPELSLEYGGLPSQELQNKYYVDGRYNRDMHMQQPPMPQDKISVYFQNLPVQIYLKQSGQRRSRAQAQDLISKNLSLKVQKIKPSLHPYSPHQAPHDIKARGFRSPPPASYPLSPPPGHMYQPQHPFNHGFGAHMPPSNLLLDPNLSMAGSPLYKHHQQLLAAQESIRQSQIEAKRIRDIIHSHR